jgi:CheY-like chemotaxis protein
MQKSLEGLNVLLVEDDADHQHLISLILTSAGAHVSVVANGQEALDETASREFDAVIIDMQMPVLDGYAATRRLRERGFTRPIIALTACAMVEDRNKCLEAGCDDFSTKPIDRDQLVELIAKWVSATQSNADLLTG